MDKDGQLVAAPPPCENLKLPFTESDHGLFRSVLPSLTGSGFSGSQAELFYYLIFLTGEND